MKDKLVLKKFTSPLTFGLSILWLAIFKRKIFETYYPSVFSLDRKFSFYNFQKYHWIEDKRKLK